MQFNPYSNQEHGLTFHLIDKAQILCYAGLYTGRERHGPTRDRVKDFFFRFNAAVQKEGSQTPSLTTTTLTTTTRNLQKV